MSKWDEWEYYIPGLYDDSSSDGYGDEYEYDSMWSEPRWPMVNSRKTQFEKREIIPHSSLEYVYKSLCALSRNFTQTLYKEQSEHKDKNTCLKLFCAQDTLLASDINVTLEGIGKLQFPLEQSMIENMFSISENANSTLPERLFDSNVRDVQLISTSKLKIELNEQAFDNVISRMRSNMNLDSNKCKLLPRLQNMLIYGPGQFYKLHRDSENITNIVATLIIILPSKFEGGHVCVAHLNDSISIPSPNNLDEIQCVMYYSDCQHELMKIREGFRVVLSYKIELQINDVQGDIDSGDINFTLENTVISHFSQTTRLVVVLEHRYSEETLRWHFLKGNDRTVATALLAVGKKQKYKVFLALSHNMKLFEECDDSSYDGYTDGSAELYYWVDENNVKIDIIKKLNRYDLQKDFIGMFDYDYTREDYKEFEKPGRKKYLTETEKWYRCACVVLIVE